MKLTADSVKALKLDGKKDLIVFDTAMPGFGYRLRLGAGGKVLRSWVAQYRHAGKSRRLLLGSAEVLSAEAARTAAKKALGLVANGADPQADKRDRRDKDNHTFRAVAANFLAVKKDEVRTSTCRELERYLTGSYFKPLHGLPIDTITRRDVADRLLAITRESGAIVASHARVTLSGLFSWALAHGLADSNPVIGTIARRAGQSRERVLSDSELARILRACGDDEYGKIIKLLILTGARRAEIGGIAWSEIDLERGVWTLAASRIKNKRAHTLPLLPAMRAIVEPVPRMAGRDQLFGAHAAEGFTTWVRGKATLDQRSGVNNWTVHDLRRTVATRMADIGIAPHIVEQVLNHQSGHRAGPAGVYNRSSYEREVRAALALWEDHVRALIEGRARKVLSFVPQTAS